jgi:hypothetical protein
MGFIAQDVDKLIPEVVSKGGEYWALNTPNMLAVVVEAMKEMWKRMEENFARDDEQDNELETLRERVAELESVENREPSTTLPAVTPVEDLISEPEPVVQVPQPETQPTTTPNATTSPEIINPADVDDTEIEEIDIPTESEAEGAVEPVVDELIDPEPESTEDEPAITNSEA